MEGVFAFSPLFQVGKSHPSQSTRRSAMPKDNEAVVYRLPNELLVQILSELPARQVTRVCQVSKVFKACIDENEAAILRSTMNSNRNRVTAQFNHVVNVTGLEFDEAIQRYYQYYGPDPSSLIYSDPLSSKDRIPNVCHNWIAKNHPDLPDGEVAVISFVLSRFVRGIVDLGGDPDEVLCAVEGAAVLKLFTDHGYYREQPEYLMKRMTRLESINTSAKPVPGQLYSMPDYLSGIQSGTSVGGNSLRRSVKRGEDYQNIGTWLGLPDIGEKGRFAYRAKARAAWWIVEDALRSGAESLSALSASKQAAVLEEIFVW